MSGNLLNLLGLLLQEDERNLKDSSIMKNRTGINSIIHILWCFALLPSFVFPQNIKPPVAEPDFASTFITNPVSVNVLANDHAYEGDTLVIYAITAVSQGQAWFEDSLIHYTPNSSNSLLGEAYVYYMIKDMTTGLWSSEAEVTISLQRPKGKIFTPNQLSARINALGNQFMAVDSFNFYGPTHHFEAPAGSGKHSIYNAALWVAGLDENGAIHTACERYRKGKFPYMSAKGWDYWVGPVMDEVHYTPEYLTEHNRLWYVTRDEINSHSANYQNSNYLLPNHIKKWPGNGYPELGTADLLAPFADRNQNGVYDPENGDYPLIHGDEAIYFVFNDDYGDHTDSFGRKLGIEVHGLAYGFNCGSDSAFNNTLFIRYQVINRSDTAYHDVYLGDYSNLVIGSHDDYLVCDTLLNTYYAYNMDDFDDTLSIMYPGYMEHPPAQAVVWLNQPIDHFMYCHFPWPHSDTLFNLAPNAAHRYYNFMQSIWNDSTHLTYGGDGHLGGAEVDHALTGDPLTGTGWLEGNPELDSLVLQGIASCGPFQFLPGDTLTLELAYVFARDYEGDHLSSVALLKERVERVRWMYQNDSTPCSTPWTSLAEYSSRQNRLTLLPNPARDYVRAAGLETGTQVAFEIVALDGTVVGTGKIKTGGKVDIGDLVPGNYFIKFYTLDGPLIGRFIKID